MTEKIEGLLVEIDKLTASGAEELEALRIKYLSKKGIVSSLMEEFRNIPSDQKREVGKNLNELKQKTQHKIQSLKDQFETSSSSSGEIDLT
ncbi:MAG TPA: phenylalanine--tRNA ligase subunit alpha, partial [Porphyromonadaceae bacterium]|nr:phenylalanine--tRNA ligase subunit alpha [Porphyromonadaceae bacterium]